MMAEAWRSVLEGERYGEGGGGVAFACEAGWQALWVWGRRLEAERAGVLTTCLPGAA